MARLVQQVKDQIFGNSLARRHANYSYPGSMLDSLATDIAVVLVDVESKYESIIGLTKTEAATGVYLDTIARDVNITRRVPERARTLYSDSNLQISTTNGEPLLDVYNEYGIDATSLTVTTNNNRVSYSIYSPIEVPPGTSMYVSARALVLGGEGNVKKGELNRFTKLYPKLRITNRYSINNGKGIEGDDSLRIRIFNKLESNLKNSNTFNGLIQTIVPSYGKHLLQNDGPGSFILYLQPANDLAYSYSSLADIGNNLRQFLPAGQKVSVRNFDIVRFKIETRIVLNTNVNQGNSIIQAKQVIQNYFDSLPGGASVSLTELEARMAGAISGFRFVSREGNHFKKVSYVLKEGSAMFEYIATPGDLINIAPHQIATIDIVDISISGE